jgi:putative SOS response-associated peptidase YedK
VCTNYAPSSRDIAEQFVPLSRAEGLWPDEVYKDYKAPLIRRMIEGEGFELLVGNYGFVPRAHMSPKFKISTLNARSAEVGEKPTYARAWRATQLCLLPTRHYYEWRYAPGAARPERWAIGMADGSDFCVAAIWRDWIAEDGVVTSAFAQFTANADHHALLSQFHRPEDEKRGVVILPRDAYEDWLTCRDPEFARAMLQLLPAPLLTAWPAPKPSRKVGTTSFDAASSNGPKT